jgi:hypothetical protein
MLSDGGTTRALTDLCYDTCGHSYNYLKFCRYWVVPSGDVLTVNDIHTLRLFQNLLKKLSSAFGLFDKLLSLVEACIGEDATLSKGTAARLLQILQSGPAPFVIKHVPGVKGNGKYVLLSVAGSGANVKMATPEFTFRDYRITNWKANIKTHWKGIVTRMQTLDYSASYAPITAPAKDVALVPDEPQAASRQQGSGRSRKRLRKSTTALVSDDSPDDADVVDVDLEDQLEGVTGSSGLDMLAAAAARGAATSGGRADAAMASGRGGAAAAGMPAAGPAAAAGVSPVEAAAAASMLGGAAAAGPSTSRAAAAAEAPTAGAAAPASARGAAEGAAVAGTSSAAGASSL